MVVKGESPALRGRVRAVVRLTPPQFNFINRRLCLLRDEALLLSIQLQQARRRVTNHNKFTRLPRGNDQLNQLPQPGIIPLLLFLLLNARNCVLAFYPSSRDDRISIRLCTTSAEIY